MSKPEQILVVEPVNELKFKGQFTSPITSYIILTNPTDDKVCFKIKTTAPKRYCVRPNSGVVEPLSSVEIAVTLQSFDFDNIERAKHKFMVQSIVAPATEDFNVETLYKEATNESLMESKLKCVFEGLNDEVPTAPMYLLAKEDSKKKDASAPQNSADSSESEIQKASNEITRLREDLSSLQQENLQLKEDLLKYVQSKPNQQWQQSQHRSNQQAYVANNQMPLLYLIFGVLIGMLSMFLGKYIF